MNAEKSGPIHFYTSYERRADMASLVEYCVQVGERQPLNKTQAQYLVGKGAVLIDGQRHNLSYNVPHGTWEIEIRGKKHHVVVHGALVE